MTFVSGWDPAIEDFRAIEQTATDVGDRLSDLFGAPEEIDPRRWHRIENQGRVGSCQGFALSSVGELGFHVATGKVKQFSAMWCYLMSQRIGGLTGDRGSRLIDGLTLAKTKGFCPDEVFPYPGFYTTTIPAGCAAAALPYRIQYHAMCRSYDQVFQFLATHQGGVEIGVSWGGMTPRADGVLERYRRGALGGHAMAFLGYSRRLDNQGRKYLWLANSHSEDWGNQGWAEVSPTAVEEMLEQRDSVMIGLSDLTTPEPRKFNWSTQHVLA